MEHKNDFDLKVSLKRKEHSKDINGSDKIFTLVEEKLYYTERFWGFKSEKRKAQKKSLKLSDKDQTAIFSYISENEMNINYQEIIKIDERHLRNVFTYIVELNTPEGLTIYQIQSNDQNSDNKSWIKMENLFDLLQDFIEKG